MYEYDINRLKKYKTVPKFIMTMVCVAAVTCIIKTSYLGKFRFHECNKVNLVILTAYTFRFIQSNFLYIHQTEILPSRLADPDTRMCNATTSYFIFQYFIFILYFTKLKA